MPKMASSQALGAEIIARHAHEHQVDKGGRPYVLHLEAVAAQVHGDEMQATAWLHDIIEDTPVGEQDLRNMGFNDVVVEAVLLLTHTHESTRQEYLNRIRDAKGPAGELARAVKIADLRHNMSEERRLPGKEGERMHKRYVSDLALLTTRFRTVGEYANALVRHVRDDWDAGQLESIGSWEGLHFVCDANEYIVDVDEEFGIDSLGNIEFLNEAIAMASSILWPDSQDPEKGATT